MPIYEYRCATCGFQKEYLQKVNDPRLTDCPECGKPTFDKMLSAAGFQLKGSGWYVTDFKNNGAKPKPTDGGKAAATESGKAGAAESGKAEAADSGKADTSETKKSEPKKEEKKPDASASSASTAST